MGIYAKINPYSVKAIPDGALNDNVMLAVAGEAITAGKVLQLKSDGKVYVADITNLEGKVIGIALKNASTDSTLYVKISGVLRGVITGLTQGEFYYLDTSGNITANPSGSRVLIGKALSDDELLLMLDITSNAVFGKSVFVKTALTGGTPDALDSIDGALLQDGDIAFVTQGDSFSVYVLDADSGLAEDSPKIIAPDANAGNKRWILKSLVGGSGDSVFYGKVNIETISSGVILEVIGDPSYGRVLFSNRMDDATDKLNRIGVRHYSNSEEPFYALNLESVSDANRLNLGGGTGAGNAATVIRFFTAEDTTTLRGTERMCITSDGNVGIGTTAPTNKLHIVAPNQVGLKVEGGVDIGGYFGSGRSTTGLGVYGNSEFQNNLYIGGKIGIGTTTPDNILTVVQGSATDPIADAWTTYSSIRWKTDLEEIKDALDKVKQLTGRYFTWTIGDKKGKRDIGFVAEEVGAVEPLLVEWDSEKDENGNPYAHALKYERITALLVNAVKELAQKVEELESKIQ